MHANTNKSTTNDEKWEAIDASFVQQLIGGVTDNHGRTLDRYTIYFLDASYLTLSHNPSSPDGVSTWGEDGLRALVGRDDEESIEFDSLPTELQQHVVNQVRAAYEGFILDNPTLTAQDVLQAILNGHKYN